MGAVGGTHRWDLVVGAVGGTCERCALARSLSQVGLWSRRPSCSPAAGPGEPGCCVPSAGLQQPLWHSVQGQEGRDLPSELLLCVRMCVKNL